MSLPAAVYSPDHVGIVLWELERHLADVRNDASKSKASEEPTASHHLSSFLDALLDKMQADAHDLTALEKLRDELRSVRDQAPIGHFLLAALPGQKHKQELVTWCRANLHPDMLMTFAARSDIGGGFMLRVGSKHYDFTYSSRLHESRQRLVEIFDHV